MSTNLFNIFLRQELSHEERVRRLAIYIQHAEEEHAANLTTNRTRMTRHEYLAEHLLNLTDEVIEHEREEHRT